MLAVSDFNRLDQYASSPGKRAYTVTQNSLSSIAEAETIASIHCVYPRRLNWPGWLNAVRGDMPDRRGSPIPVLTGFNVEQPRWYAQRRYNNAKPPTMTDDDTIDHYNFTGILDCMVIQTPSCSESSSLTHDDDGNPASEAARAERSRRARRCRQVERRRRSTCTASIAGLPVSVTPSPRIADKFCQATLESSMAVGRDSTKRR